MPPPLFEVQGLRVEVQDPDRIGVGDDPWVVGIPDLSYAVAEGEVLALVGESGSGKSLALLGAFGLLPRGTRATAGVTRFDGSEFRPAGRPVEAATSWRERRRRRRSRPIAGTVADELPDEAWARRMGLEVGFLFQNPIASWMPVETIGPQAGEVLEVHGGLSSDEIERRVVAALGEVQLPAASRFFRAFRHQMSRGQGQRAMLASALVKAPRLLVADEPLSGLDPPVAAAILDLIRDLQHRRGMAMVVVTHDLGTVARIADRVAVVYAGRIVEEGPVSEVFHRPQHPYTAGLLGSIPGRSRRLRPIPGEAPRLGRVPRGCAFAPRCAYADAACLKGVPPLEPIGRGKAACVRSYLLDLPGV